MLIDEIRKANIKAMKERVEGWLGRGMKSATPTS